jgi:hypothetical protein
MIEVYNTLLQRKNRNQIVIPKIQTLLFRCGISLHLALLLCFQILLYLQLAFFKLMIALHMLPFLEDLEGSLRYDHLSLLKLVFPILHSDAQCLKTGKMF